MLMSMLLIAMMTLLMLNVDAKDEVNDNGIDQDNDDDANLWISMLG